MNAAEWWKYCIVCEKPNGIEVRPAGWTDDFQRMCADCRRRLRKAKTVDVGEVQL